MMRRNGTTGQPAGRPGMAPTGAAVAVLAVLLAILMTGTVAAQPAQGWKMYGPGGQSCRAYLDSPPGGKQFYAAWTLGYLSGANFFTTAADVIGITKTRQIVGFIDGFCRQNPAVPFGEAARALFLDLSRRPRAPQPPPQ